MLKNGELMMKKEKRPVAVVSALIKKEGKYLAVFEPRFNEAGLWRTPGGRIENEERAEDTLVREMKEELNVEVNVNKFLGFGQDTVTIRKKVSASRLIIYFECEILSGEPKLGGDEATEMRWVTLEEMKKLEPLEQSLSDLFSRFKIEGINGGIEKCQR